jgi:hypothetical protein
VSIGRTLIVYGVRNEAELAAYADLFKAEQRKSGEFYEPDRGGELTAVAVEQDAADRLKDLRLL